MQEHVTSAKGDSGHEQSNLRKSQQVVVGVSKPLGAHMTPLCAMGDRCGATGFNVRPLGFSPTLSLYAPFLSLEWECSLCPIGHVTCFFLIFIEACSSEFSLSLRREIEFELQRMLEQLITWELLEVDGMPFAF